MPWPVPDFQCVRPHPTGGGTPAPAGRQPEPLRPLPALGILSIMAAALPHRALLMQDCRTAASTRRD